jgi:predicted HNH restriction endonuclease
MIPNDLPLIALKLDAFENQRFQPGSDREKIWNYVKDNPYSTITKIAEKLSIYNDKVSRIIDSMVADLKLAPVNFNYTRIQLLATTIDAVNVLLEEVNHDSLNEKYRLLAETGKIKIEPSFVDQFSTQETEAPEARRRDRTGTELVRDPGVKQRALNRAQGKCEYCGDEGFPTVSGQIYLESHHVIPLFEGGPDSEKNIAALCPNHHRQAHHGKNRNEIRETLQKRLAVEN